ncbi:MAG TPA: M48 family metalloprotease [Candidatus Binatia bacterium]|nr:M48 family metalloprotease [Candidatus Binatia bacterium]
MRPSRGLTLCTLVLLAAGCARNPVSGRPQVTLVSEATERELSDAEAKKVAATMGIYDDAALAAYVRVVGERLARVSPRQSVSYTFQVVDMREPNAFALPAGQVYISRGLLALLNSEDELACVLGHEVGHVAARHAAQRVTRAAPIGILTGIPAAVTGIVSPVLGDVVGGIGGFAGALVLAPYSRGQEQEADEIGQRLAAKAGWDPAALSSALRTLEREETLHRGEERRTSFFATHPPLPDRVAATEVRAATLARAAATPVAADRATFVGHLNGLPVAERARDGVFDGQTFRHPDLDFQLEFPPGWKTANGRSVVGAAAADGRAVVGLEVVGAGDDPQDGLRALEQKAKVDLASSAERMDVNGLPAVHVTTTARTRERRIALDLTWIAYAGHVYRITGAMDPDGVPQLTPLVRSTAQSFRPLTRRERATIREKRLRVVLPRRGERLVDMLARTGSSWEVATAAMANGVEGDAPLATGWPVKVAVDEPYGR